MELLLYRDHLIGQANPSSCLGDDAVTNRNVGYDAVLKNDVMVISRPPTEVGV